MAGVAAGNSKLTCSRRGPLLISRTCSLSLPTFTAHTFRWRGLGLRSRVCTSRAFGSERAREQDQAVQQRACHEPRPVELERVVDRGLTGMKMDSPHARLLQLEYRVRRPQGCRVCITEAIEATAGDRVELCQHERQAGPSRKDDSGLDRLRHAGSGVLAQEPVDSRVLR